MWQQLSEIQADEPNLFHEMREQVTETGVHLTACGRRTELIMELLVDDHWKLDRSVKCQVCWEILRLISTSADDLRSSLRCNPENRSMEVLQRAYEICEQRHELTKCSHLKIAMRRLENDGRK